jgi:hypothetical protein
VAAGPALLLLLLLLLLFLLFLLLILILLVLLFVRPHAADSRTLIQVDVLAGIVLVGASGRGSWEVPRR